MAAPFKRHSTTVDGIEFAVFLHPDRQQLLEALAPARQEIENWLQTKLDLAAESGLRYPFTSFSLVEVPDRLRIYGGGWRSDTVLAPPSMMLIREDGLPSARFDVLEKIYFLIYSVGLSSPLSKTMKGR